MTTTRRKKALENVLRIEENAGQMLQFQRLLLRGKTSPDRTGVDLRSDCTISAV